MADAEACAGGTLATVKCQGGENTTDTTVDKTVTASGQCCTNHHNKEVMYYCKDHETDCCVLCLTNHDTCALLPMEDIYHTFSMFFQRIKRVRDCVDDGRRHLDLYLKRIQSHIHLGEEKIRSFHNRIRTIIDNAERDSLKKLDSLRADEGYYVSSYLDENHVLKERVEHILKEGDQLFDRNSSESTDSPHSSPKVSGSSDIIQFSKRYEEMVTSVEKRLADVTACTGEIQEHFVKRNETLQEKIVSDLKSAVSFSPLHVDIPVFPLKTHLVSTKKIKPKGSIRNIHILPGGNDEVLLVGMSPIVVQYSVADGKGFGCLNLPDQPNDSCVYSNMIAILFTDLKLIKHYNLTDFTELHQVQLPDRCTGICRTDTSFVVTFCDEGVVRSIDDNGQVISSSGKLFSRPIFVTTSNYYKYVFVSDEIDHRVVIMSPDLKYTLFRLSHTDMNIPRDICVCVDRVFVCCQGRGCIVEFTVDGKYVSTVRYQKDGIKNPYRLCYDKHGPALMIVSALGDKDQDEIQMFKIEPFKQS